MVCDHRTSNVGNPVYGEIDNPLTLNPYSYAWNNPLRYADPTGLMPQENPTVPRPPQNKDYFAPGEYQFYGPGEYAPPLTDYGVTEVRPGENDSVIPLDTNTPNTNLNAPLNGTRKEQATPTGQLKPGNPREGTSTQPGFRGDVQGYQYDDTPTSELARQASAQGIGSPYEETGVLGALQYGAALVTGLGNSSYTFVNRRITALEKFAALSWEQRAEVLGNAAFGALKAGARTALGTTPLGQAYGQVESFTNQYDKIASDPTGTYNYITSKRVGGLAYDIGNRGGEEAINFGIGAAVGGPFAGRLSGPRTIFDGNIPGGVRGTGGIRQSRLNELTPDEIARIKQEFAEVGGDEGILRFNRGRQTSYVDEKDIINIRGDVFPLEGATHPRSAMSSRAALAHELGHRAHRGTRLPPGAWNDEFRASYWAAKNTPNLTDIERVHLIQDAISRAQEAGIPIRINPFMRRTLYGF